MPFLYSPNEVQCNKCLQIVAISSLYIHNTTCEKRVHKKSLGTIVEEITDDSRVVCKYCKRKFALDRISKHQSACEISSKKRPLFNMIKKRIPYLCDTYQKINSKRGSLNLIYPNSKWQKQHLDLIKNLRVTEDTSATEDPISCPYCLKKILSGSTDKHIEACKSSQSMHKESFVLPKNTVNNRFPSLRKIEKHLSIRTSSTNSLWRPSSVYNKKRIFDESKITTFDLLDNSIIAENNDNTDTSPFKVPLIIKKELIDPNYTKSNKKKYSTSACPLCLKTFITSTIDKHILTCHKQQLRPSATVDHLEKKEESLKPARKKPRISILDKKRSNSTQRLRESGIICSNCAAVYPKQAKFCMMCGNIRL
jgi:zinc-finger of a C2HC-type